MVWVQANGPTACKVTQPLLRCRTAPDPHSRANPAQSAGWHTSLALRVPDNVTLVPLPPYAPELKPVERVWLYMRERFLSHRLHADYGAVLDATCDAWRKLAQNACNP